MHVPETFSGFAFALVALLQVPARPIAFSYASSPGKMLNGPQENLQYPEWPPD